MYTMTALFDQRTVDLSQISLPMFSAVSAGRRLREAPGASQSHGEGGTKRPGAVVAQGQEVSSVFP